MLRYKETEDIDARFSEVERAVVAWRQVIGNANSVARTEFNNRLRISLIHHDAALEGEVLSYSEIKAAVDPSIISDPSLIPSYEEIRRFDDACNFAAEQAGSARRSGPRGEGQQSEGYCHPGPTISTDAGTCAGRKVRRHRNRHRGS